MPLATLTTKINYHAYLRAYIVKMAYLLSKYQEKA